MLSDSNACTNKGMIFI
uniref:Uncharacterized protein n=1 Tax=Arundo donax TaxID=35708 RepID=A0A0A8Y803_ARUDO